MRGLTRQQADILQFIRRYIDEKGYSPTFRDIQLAFDFASLGSVYGYVKALKKKGALVNEKNAPITLQKPLETRASTDLQLPLIGTLAAGFPIETFHHSQQIDVPRSFVQHEESTYVLRVKGDTLVNERINDGDFLVIEARSEAEEGELVLATLNGQDTIVKRYHPEGGYLRLEGAEESAAPLMLHPEEVDIQGVIIALLRSYQ